jgi:HD-GYP domain-containing protein (c-di-GMP phosphodiesterase class II)
MVEDGEADANAALVASVMVCDILGQAETIRAESFTQTRDEVVRFYHSYQQEIDRFPSNLAATFDFSTLMLSAVKKCKDLVGVGRCAFFTRDLLTNELHLEAANFDNGRVFGDSNVKLDGSLVKKLVHQGKTVTVEGYPHSMPLVSSIMKKLKTKMVVLVPLMVRNRNAGVMMLDNIENPQMFTSETINLAERFASKVAAAMENARLHGSEQKKLKETMALLEVSRLVTSTLDIDVLLSRLVQITADVCEVGKCTVYIYLEEGGRFFPTATFGMFPQSEWETTLSEGILPEDLVAEEAEALMRFEVAVSDAQLSPFIPEERILDTGVKSVLLVPVNSRNNLHGIMVLFYDKERDELENEDQSLVTAIASQAAVAMENATLYEDLEMSYFSTVKALARAIEVKDPYTYGHSERVTVYALVIARKLGLPEWHIRNIKYAAALHDIGKLGIARSILNKPGGLTEEEFVHVKTHPQMGDLIIEPVNFLSEPREIILHHHERYDGRGYPDGLKGEEISLGARILAVADSFEAMMSDRPYRRALDLHEAIDEITVNAGSQFDPEVVKAFIEALSEGDVIEKAEVEEETRDSLEKREP